MDRSASRTVMWQATCRHLPFEEQCKAARLAGCDSLTVTPLDLSAHLQAGGTAAGLRRVAESEGVVLAHLDPLARWTDKWQAPNIPPHFYPFLDFETERFLDMATDLGAESFTAIGTFEHGEVETDRLIDDFAHLVEMAEARDLRTDLEFIRIWGLATLTQAWEIVSACTSAHAGIMFDFWHFVRGGSEWDVLETIPGNRMHAVKVCDGPLTRGAGRSDLQDCLDDRLPAGEGAFPIQRLISTLGEKRALGRVGPEYYSERMNGLSPRKIADVVERTYWSAMVEVGMKRDGAMQ